MKAYHGTSHQINSFSEKPITEFGYHFAKNPRVLLSIYKLYEEKKDFWIYICELTTKTIIELPDFGDWTDLKEWKKYGFFDKEIPSITDEKYDREVNNIRKELLDNKINCIEYENTHEHYSKSYIMLDASDIKIMKELKMTEEVKNYIRNL